MSATNRTAVSVRFRVPSKHNKKWYDYHEWVGNYTEDIAQTLEDVRKAFPTAVIDSIKIIREDENGNPI